VARLSSDPALPGLAIAGARAVPPPPAIPLPGPGVRPLGTSDAGAPRPVGLAVPDARHHMRICGPTGTGKTTLIVGQVLADAAEGRGVVFIDPKGDAVLDTIARLPENVAGKVVLFDPGDRAAPPCLNVLQGDGTGTDTDMVVDNLTGIFRRIFSANWVLNGVEDADIWCDSRHAVCRRILVCAVVGGRVRWRRHRADEGIRRPSRYLSGRGVPGGPCRARRRCAHGKGRCCLGRGPACQG
jgi:hypothetical protein